MSMVETLQFYLLKVASPGFRFSVCVASFQSSNLKKEKIERHRFIYAVTAHLFLTSKFKSMAKKKTKVIEFISHNVKYEPVNFVISGTGAPKNLDFLSKTQNCFVEVPVEMCSFSKQNKPFKPFSNKSRVSQ